MTRRAALAALLLAVTAAASCGDDETTVVSAPPPPPTDGLVIRVERAGGFLPSEGGFEPVPSMSVYADGRVLAPGATIQIYPGPALVPLHQSDVGRDTVEGLLARAEELGLLEEPPDYGQPPVADAPDTVVTIVTADARYEHRATALEESSDVSAEQADARERLQTFLREVEQQGFQGGSTTEFVPDAYVARAVAEEPTVDPGSPEPQPRVVDWPTELLTPAEIGSCTVFEDDAARALEELFADADQLTFFRDAAGATWRVSVRPVLPDEDGCADLER